MAVIAELADGRRLEFPDGTDPAVVQATVKKVLGAAQKPIGPPQELSGAEKYLAPVLEKLGIGDIPEQPVRGLVQGAADPVIGAAQLFTPKGSAADNAIKAQLEGYEKGRGKDAGSFDWSRMAGSALGPMSLLIGGAPAATTAAARVGQGAAMGTIGGITNPVTSGDFQDEKFSQMILGGAFGGAIPGAWEGAKALGRYGRNIIEPILGKSGAERSAGRLARELSGDKTDEIIDALASAKGRVTAGQAALPAGSAEFSALSKIAESNKPTPSQALRAEQQAARAAAVREIAKTPDEMAAAKAARSASADANYGEAYRAALKADPELAQMASNPYFKDAIPAAAKLAKARGIDPKTNLTEFLQFVKEGLDKQLSKTGDDALEKTAKETVAGLKTQLLTWMDAKNPAFGKARQEFAAQSKPINQMVAGAELEKALTSGTGKERSTAFTNAVDNATRIPELRRKAGAQRFGSLDEVLTPEQMASVRGVAGELKRDVSLDDLASAGMSKTSRAVGEFEPHKLVNPLERTVMIVNAIISRAAGKGSKRTMDALSDLNLNPGGLAEAMKKATPRERSEIIDALMRAQAAGIGQAQ